MTRAFTPPESMSKQDIRTVADVRRDIWTSAFWGMGVGSFSCLALHTALQIASRRSRPSTRAASSMLPPADSLNRNTALLSFLAGGAFGSFLMATTTGKNQVHRLHPIFQVGSSLQDQQQQLEQEYKDSLIRARQREDDLEQMEEQHQLLYDRSARREGISYDEERALRQKNRMLRRKTLYDNLQHGRGQTDSHGGRWAAEGEEHDHTNDSSTLTNAAALFVDPNEERAMRQKNRMMRRKTLQDTIDRGHGQSDSHGGRWVNNGADN